MKTYRTLNMFFTYNFFKIPPIILKIRCLFFNMAHKPTQHYLISPLAFLLLPNTPVIFKGRQCVWPIFWHLLISWPEMYTMIFPNSA